MLDTSYPVRHLSEFLAPVKRGETPLLGTKYRQIGVRLWGVGAYERETIDGGQTRYKTLYRVEENDIIINKIWARNGSVSTVSQELAGCYGSSEFPTFVPDQDVLLPDWFYWITKTKWFWKQCHEKSYGTSGKNRIRPEKFLKIKIPLPSLEEQHRIVARIEALAIQVQKVKEIREDIDVDIRSLLLNAYRQTIEGAEYQPMEVIAPRIRRAVNVEVTKDYYELGVRSFGKGTFHKPALNGLNVGSKRLFSICPGDLVFSNVFSWEGAIAVAKPEDDGRVGSHRFITCVPKEKVAIAEFLCFHFLAPEGLEDICAASPGGAGRNRTLGLKKLDAIQVPVPDFDKQLWFKSLLDKVDAMRSLQFDKQGTLDQLMPSILDRAFRGEL